MIIKNLKEWNGQIRTIYHCIKLHILRYLFTRYHYNVILCTGIYNSRRGDYFFTLARVLLLIFECFKLFMFFFFLHLTTAAIALLIIRFKIEYVVTFLLYIHILVCIRLYFTYMK